MENDLYLLTDSIENFTYIGAREKSTIDFIWVDINAFYLINNFSVSTDVILSNHLMHTISQYDSSNNVWNHDFSQQCLSVTRMKWGANKISKYKKEILLASPPNNKANLIYEHYLNWISRTQYQPNNK